MIRKLKSANHMDVFDGYHWPIGKMLNEFKRFNIIYGSKGSGKTALSQFVSHCVPGEYKPSPCFKYLLEEESGTLKIFFEPPFSACL